MISASVTIYQLPTHTQTHMQLLESKSNGSVFTAKSKIVPLYMESKKATNFRFPIVVISSDIRKSYSLPVLSATAQREASATDSQRPASQSPLHHIVNWAFCSPGSACRPPPPQIVNWASRPPASRPSPPQVKTWVTRTPAPLPSPPQNLRWPPVPRPSPPQMIDWASVRASNPEEEKNYQIWEEVTGRYSGWRPG